MKVVSQEVEVTRFCERLDEVMGCIQDDFQFSSLRSTDGGLEADLGLGMMMVIGKRMSLQLSLDIKTERPFRQSEIRVRSGA